jgi:hypothetical protein
VYDLVNDRIYVGVHYNWVDGFNPFFHVTDADRTPYGASVPDPTITRSNWSQEHPRSQARSLGVSIGRAWAV